MSLLRTFTCFAICFLLSSISSAVESEPVEGEPVFFARELVGQLDLKTDAYSVSPVVEVRSFFYEFSVRSRYGVYRVQGIDQLKELLHELAVIEELEDVSQSRAFTSSLSSSLADPVSTTLGVARRPVASVTGLPGGVVRYLGGKLYQVRRGSGKAMDKVREMRSKDEEEAEVPEVPDEPKEKKQLGKKAGKLSRKHLGHDASKRRWARQLGVDPYSDNLALQESLGRIAWASTLGGLAGDYAIPSSEVFSYAGKAQQLVWNRPAHQLEREIVDILKKCDVEKEWIQLFRDSDMYSLTEKLRLCLAFKRLRGANAAPFLVEYSLGAESEEDVSLFLDTVDVLIRYQEQVAEFTMLGEKRGMIYACSDKGYEIYPLAVDYLHWTPLVYDALLSEELASAKREIWVAGVVSPVAKMRLRHHGWQVFDRIGL